MRGVLRTRRSPTRGLGQRHNNTSRAKSTIDLVAACRGSIADKGWKLQTPRKR